MADNIKLNNECDDKINIQYSNEIIQEEWRDVVGFEGFYQVSNYGQVRSVDRTQIIIWNGKEVKKPIKGKIIAQNIQNGGYKIANLSANGKRREMTVHRMVAMAFIENPLNLKEVNHKDGNKYNNNVQNLEWVSRSENLKHRARVLGQRGNAVKVKCLDTGKIYNAIKDAAADVGVSGTSIYISINKKQKSGGYTWVRV